MHSERRGILSVIEVYIDMLINLGAIAISYLFIKMINWGEEIDKIINAYSAKFNKDVLATAKALLNP